MVRFTSLNLGFLSFVIKEKLFLAESLVATLVGICFGPVGAKAIDPIGGNMQATNLAFSDIIICIQIMAAAISLPKKFWLRRWKSMTILLGPVVLYKWLMGALIFYGVLGRPFVESLILSGCTAPTDPVLVNSITSGRFADMHIPLSIRQLLSAESAANDGIVLPIWSISVYLYKYNIGAAFSKWGYKVLAYEMILSVIFGVLMGLGTRWALYYSDREGWIDKKNFFSFEIALTLFVVGVSQILHLSTFISIFVTGLVFSWDGWFAAETEEAHVQEVIDNLLNLTYFVYFGICFFLILGASLPWADFNSDTLPLWRLILTGICLLLLRRLPIILALYKYTPPLYTLQDAALVGWFGPIGIGALWYMSAAALFLPENTTIVPIIMFVVFINVIAFGITVPFVHMTILTISSISRSRSVEVPRWPENTPISANMISGPSVVPLNRITSNLSYSGSRLVSPAQFPSTSSFAANSTTELAVSNPSDNTFADNKANNADQETNGKEENGLTPKSSVVFNLENRD